MTQPEYEQKRCECWEEFKNAAFNGDISYSTCSALDFAFDRAYALGKQEKDADTVISGWAARDGDGDLYVYRENPERDNITERWYGKCVKMTLHNTLFPDLTWESDPIEVELIIKRKKNG